MDCVKCDGVLSEVEVGGVSVDRCGDCQGIWFDSSEVRQLIADRPAAAGKRPPLELLHIAADSQSFLRGLRGEVLELHNETYIDLPPRPVGHIDTDDGDDWLFDAKRDYMAQRQKFAEHEKGAA